MKLWFSCRLDEFIRGILNIEIAILILLAGFNLRREIMMFVLQIVDVFNQRALSEHSDIIPHEPIVHAFAWNYTENRIPFIPYVLRADAQWHIVKNASPAEKWYIGLVIEVVDTNDDIVLCLDVLVDAKTYYTFPMETAKQYLIDVAEEDEDAVILAADIEFHLRLNGVHDLPDFPVIVKTYWIRIIQRTWKRIYYTRLKLRGGLNAQRQFELSGKYGYLGSGLRGMFLSTNAVSSNIKTD